MMVAKIKEQVLVFKTNISTDTEVQQLNDVLNTGSIIKWNVDVDDCDKVLRIVTQELNPAWIISVLEGKGLACIELE